ncbi:MAG: iron (metal) dependent repressor [Desulfobacterales bacterium]|nr:MAG: iron (metal) dependent repressor [Desulfobacterales bacterium]
MKKRKGPSATQEDYLAAIFRIEQRHRIIRANLIAEELGVTRPTVTAALKHLSAMELIVYQPYQPIQLTEQGRKQAMAIAHRNIILFLFFRDTLKYSEEQAREIACKMEHAIDDEVVVQLGKLVLYIEQSGCIPENWQHLYSPHGKKHSFDVMLLKKGVSPRKESGRNSDSTSSPVQK